LQYNISFQIDWHFDATFQQSLVYFVIFSIFDLLQQLFEFPLLS